MLRISLSDIADAQLHIPQDRQVSAELLVLAEHDDVWCRPSRLSPALSRLAARLRLDPEYRLHPRHRGQRRARDPHHPTSASPSWTARSGPPPSPVSAAFADPKADIWAALARQHTDLYYLGVADKSDEQRAAESEVQSFRQEGGPFVVAAEETRMPMVFADANAPDNPIIFANDSFLALTGYERDEVLGHSFNFLMAQGTDPEALALVEAAFGRGHDHSSEVRYRRKDGSEFWAALFISPIRDENGDVVQHFASFIDLTQHKEEQAQSRMLIDELNHRVKNTLTTVQSIVAQVLRNTSDPEAIRESIESRLFALSRSHDLLTRENWESAGLRDVVDAALEPFGVAEGRSERISVTGENVRFPPKAALALGIAFNELATNAVKYGAFSVETGRVRIVWTIESEETGDRLILTWREENGPPVTPPSRKGFGSRVIERGLALELGGTTQLDYQPGGVVCTIDIPAPQRAGHG